MTPEEVAFCERSVPAAFAEVVSRDPDGLALGGEEPATYGELDEASDRIAEGLVGRLGEGPEPVGLMFASFRGVVEALFGVLKAGKIGMPLDPHAPEARLTRVLEDSGARLLLGDLPTVAVGELVSPDDLKRTRMAASSVALGPDSPSMLIYTSGSTGEPKGVLTRQGTQLHSALSNAYWAEIGPESRIGFAWSLSFAAAYMQIFAGLLSGATVLRYPAEERGLLDMPTWITENSVSVLSLLSSMVKPVADAAGSTGLPCVRVLGVGGERLAPGDVGLARILLPQNAHLLFACGATEASIWSWSRLDAGLIDEGSAVPVGFAEAGKTVRIVDVEDGVGEIVVTSRYLSLGYWGRQEDTDRVFSVDPSTGERSYRTGDLGRLDDQGRLIVVGRNDRMVKVAGKRVQLDAIEHALLADEQVGEAAVLAHQRSNGTTTLVGYVTPSSGTVEARVVKERLGRDLPPYMVPSRIVVLAVMPRLPNGKLDRRTLADHRVSADARSSALAQPTDDVERRLVRIWQELLELPVGIDDDFFDLGGDSLLATEMLVAIEDDLSCSLTPAALLQAPTVAALARLIDEVRSGRFATPSGHTINPRSDRPPLFVAYPLGGSGLRYRPFAEALGDEFPLHIFEAPWWDGGSSELRTIKQLAALHVAEIRQVQTEGPYLLAGYSMGGLIALEMAEQLTAAGQKIALLMMFDTYVGIRGGHTSDPRNWPMAPPTSFGHRLLRRTWLTWATQRFRVELAWSKTAFRVRRLRWWLDHRRLGTVPKRRRAQYVYDRTVEVARTYRPVPYQGQVTLFRCTDDPSVPPDRGWSAIARGGLEIYDVPGRHADLFFPPAVMTLASQASPLIRDAWETGSEERELQRLA